MTRDIEDAMKKCKKVEFRQSQDERYREGLFWKEKTRCQNINMKELAMGIDVEMEHTNSNIFSAKIALDHLTECDSYYTRLKKMEAECGDD